MAGVYRPLYPERTVLYRVMFHYFERFLKEDESRFERFEPAHPNELRRLNSTGKASFVRWPASLDIPPIEEYSYK